MEETAADQLIAALGMQPHPEGGYFVETFRDSGGGPRGHSTAIYFLLKRGETSAWHRVRDAAEVWHFYDGAALDLTVSDGETLTTIILGPDILAGERPQAAVPAGAWQKAASRGDFSLVGCTVAPGFAFEAFELAPEGWEPGA